MARKRILVVGAGIFGLTAALEARRRGHRVTVLERGEVPNPLAASTDISKVIRMEYGSDRAYMELAEEARTGWLRWNRMRQDDGETPVYHETGMLVATLDPMAPGGFEHDSYEALRAGGHRPRRLRGAALAERFPAWDGAFVDGFFHGCGGFAESGKTVRWLAERARREGVEVFELVEVMEIEERAGRVAGVRGSGGERHEADRVILASGSWTAGLLAELGEALDRTYHPAWHLRPREPERFAADVFPTFTADVARTGFYGFPLHPEAGVVKIGHHGAAVPEPADGSLTVPPAVTDKLADFLERYFPSLADATIDATRLCPYCDTSDGDFWLDGHPSIEGLIVASGGSGHAFKFAPILGRLVADVAGIELVTERPAVERATDESGALAESVREKFRWRPEVRLDRGREAARCHEELE